MIALKKFAFCLLAAAFCCASSACAEDKPYVVLALSGGGIKGYAHIGVLEELEKEGIGVAGVVGTSMGSIIGSIYASGMTPQEMGQIVKKINLGDLVTATGNGYFNLSEKTYRDISMIRPEIHTNANNDVVGPLGLVSGTAVLEYLAELLSHVAVTDFSKLPIPFAAVATDLVTGEKVVLRRGSLPSAVRASMSIPGVFDPWEINGRLLVDGGMVSNMPVETAKELFPGYPVIAVNLTSELEPREKMSSLMSVLSQSITILTMQNVRREAALADLVINPGVKEYPMLGTNPADEIIQQGRDAAVRALPQIRALAKNAPRKPIKPKTPLMQSAPNVVSVRVTGVPAKMAAEIERELMQSWKGRPPSIKKLAEASASIAEREDVRSVDYDLEETEEGTRVLLKIQRLPAHIYKFGGYANTLAGEGWLKVEAKSYDLFTSGDTLQSRIYLSDSWGADFNYYWGMDVQRKNYWEAGLSATRYKIDPDGGSMLKWQRYAFDIQRHFTLHDRLHVAAGVTTAAVRHVQGGDGFNYIAPFADVTLNMLDDPDDPVNGWLLNVRASWPDETESMLMRATLMGRQKLSDQLVLELSGGYAEGEKSDNRLFAAWLGAREELYTLADHPIESERFAWWRAKLRYPLMETMFGSIIAEFFGGQGFAWDDDGSTIRHPWEAGLALCMPRKLVEGRFYAAYTDREEWRFGMSIGVPDWDVFHLF